MPIYQPQIPRLCTNVFQFFQPWWSTHFTYKVITLLETAGLCVLVFACLLFCTKNKVFESIDYYGIVYDTGTSLCSCITSILLSSCWLYYNYQPRPSHWSQCRNWNTSCHYWPLDSRRNKSGIANRQGKYRYFQNRIISRTERARARLYPNFPPDKPTSDPSSSPSLRSLASKVLPQFFLPQVHIPKLIKLYYWVHEKYWSWKRQRLQRK